MQPAEAQTPPGAETPARSPRLRWELLGCALQGHELLGPADAEATGRAVLLVREGSGDGFAWLRCLRCDAWVPLPDEAAPGPRTGDEAVDESLVPPCARPAVA